MIHKTELEWLCKRNQFWLEPLIAVIMVILCMFFPDIVPLCHVGVIFVCVCIFWSLSRLLFIVGTLAGYQVCFGAWQWNRSTTQPHMFHWRKPTPSPSHTTPHVTPPLLSYPLHMQNKACATCHMSLPLCHSQLSMPDLLMAFHILKSLQSNIDVSVAFRPDGWLPKSLFLWRKLHAPSEPSDPLWRSFIQSSLIYTVTAWTLFTQNDNPKFWCNKWFNIQTADSSSEVFVSFYFDLHFWQQRSAFLSF